MSKEFVGPPSVEHEPTKDPVVYLGGLPDHIACCRHCGSLYSTAVGQTTCPERLAKTIRGSARY